MRFVTWFLGLLLSLTYAQSQVLVIAGGENDALKQKARTLVQNVPKQKDEQDKWIEKCRKAGFHCEEKGDVLYLFPLQYTTASVQKLLVPCYEWLKNREQPAQIGELPDEYRAVLSSVLQERIRYQLTGTTPEDFSKMLQEGKVWISSCERWTFTLNHAGKSYVVGGSRRGTGNKPFRPDPATRPIFDRQPATLQELEELRSRYEREKREWWFLSSVPLEFEQKVEHLSAYLEWLKNFQRQNRLALEIESQRLRERMKEQTGFLGEVGGTCQLSELPSEVRDSLTAEIKLTTGVEQVDSETELIFTSWSPCLTIGYWMPRGNEGFFWIHCRLDQFISD